MGSGGGGQRLGLVEVPVLDLDVLVGRELREVAQDVVDVVIDVEGAAGVDD